MSINVIPMKRKTALQQAASPLSSKISLQSITITTEEGDDVDQSPSVYIDEAVKKVINITYDQEGNPNITSENLGMQYDNRVVWLHADLDNLLRQIYQEGYDDETKWNRYIFKWHFKLKTAAASEEANSWQFDPQEDFEVPREVTGVPGKYEVTLSIQEDLDYNHSNLANDHTDDPLTPNPWEGNVTKELEVFVCAPWVGKVDTSTIYNPSLDIQVYRRHTDQKRALIKPAIEGTLTDEGELDFSTNILGRQQDRYIKYIKFNPQKITNHLHDFTLIAAFRSLTTTLEDGSPLLGYSLFEEVQADDLYDDVTESYPIIAWVPPAVTNLGGKWQVCILAFAGKVDTVTLAPEDYYFYVSKPQKMKVENSYINNYDINKDANILMTPTVGQEYFLTGDDEGFFTSLEQIIQARDAGK